MYVERSGALRIQESGLLSTLIPAAYKSAVALRPYPRQVSVLLGLLDLDAPAHSDADVSGPCWVLGDPPPLQPT